MQLRGPFCWTCVLRRSTGRDTFRAARISKNVPLYVMDQVKEVADLDTPLFVYCHSGARSREAVSMLERMGYQQVKNIGGITAYKGEVER